MRSAILLSAVLLFDAIRNSPNAEGFYSEQAIIFISVIFVIFFSMDVIEFYKRVTNA